VKNVLDSHWLIVSPFVSALFQRLLKESYHQVVVDAAAQTQQRDEIGKHEIEIQGLKKIVARLEERLEALQAEKREQIKLPKVSNSTAVIVARSCEELRRSNESVESGMYWIDPDGHGTGDAPIHVSCNMTTGCQKRIASVLLSSLQFLYLENRIYSDPARQRRTHRCWPLLGCRMLQPPDPIQCHYETNDRPLGIII
jgi:hypothetical protein